MSLPVALVFLTDILFLKKRLCQVKRSFSTYKRMYFFLFPPPPLLLSLPHFFPGRKNVGHPGAAWSPERSLGHPRHGGDGPPFHGTHAQMIQKLVDITMVQG